METPQTIQSVEVVLAAAVPTLDEFVAVAAEEELDRKRVLVLLEVGADTRVADG